MLFEAVYAHTKTSVRNNSHYLTVNNLSPSFFVATLMVFQITKTAYDKLFFLLNNKQISRNCLDIKTASQLIFKQKGRQNKQSQTPTEYRSVYQTEYVLIEVYTMLILLVVKNELLAYVRTPKLMFETTCDFITSASVCMYVSSYAFSKVFEIMKGSVCLVTGKIILKRVLVYPFGNSLRLY